MIGNAVRLECLKMASQLTREKDEILNLAKVFEEYVSGLEINDTPSEVPKKGRGRPKKSGNVDDLI